MVKFVPCFFFHSKLFKTLLVIHFLYSKNKKKVNALGKTSARADDKPGYFFKWPYCAGLHIHGNIQPVWPG